MGTKVSVDLSKKKKIWVTFDFDPRVVDLCKRVPGHKFVPKEKSTTGTAGWEFPLDINICRRLREMFGQDLVLGVGIKKWAKQRIGAEGELKSLAVADAAPLKRLPKALPKLWRAVHVGPRGRDMGVKELQKEIKADPKGSFQTADVSYLARALNPLNGNQPGLGKTLETIAAIFEAGQENGPHLVIAPLTSLDSVWRTELERWQEYPVWVATGDKSQRNLIIEDFLCTEGAGWLVINHHMAQQGRTENLADGTWTYWNKFPLLHECDWATVTLDEVHKAGFRDTNSLMYRGMTELGQRAGKKFALSGTPVGGKPVNLWHILHWLEPDEFSNKWQWAELWCDIDNNGFGKNIVRIRPDKEEEFYEAHAPYFLRRLKSEVLPDLPDKLPIDIWVDMEAKQAKQYEEMALAAEVKIEDEHLGALGILAEYVRLKQFAISYNTIEYYWDNVAQERKFRPIPTTTSCKLDALEQLLEERGVFDLDGKEQVVVFSQFSQVVDMVYDWLLKKKGVEAVKITGDVSKKERDVVQKNFQEGIGRVICMTTTAGGVSITLDMADTVIFMDETWDPGDQEQGSDRIHRASRIHQVTVYTIRSRHTIEEYIEKVLLGKENVNKIILDLRRQGLRATEKAA